MLVITWEALNDAIPRLQAEEYLAAYTVSVVSSPAHDYQSLAQRTQIVDEWRKTVLGRAKRAIEISFAALGKMLRGSFQEQIRD